MYSQLMIQRNMDGYATTTEKSELKEVLKKIRETIPDEDEEWTEQTFTVIVTLLELWRHG